MKYMPGTLYLESSDFQGMRLKPEATGGRVTVVMLQALWCGYCTQAKDAYHKLRNHPKICFATIQADDQKDIAMQIMKTKQLGGYPAYVAFDSTGNLVGVHNGGRDEASLISFGSQFK